ncbi:MAG: hypothetical protein C5B55_04900 [Blastocatellia bacterium]|nr:MAG: hypothetical protein C5B55_04900 [Blastocatellia bacterium]
MLIELSKLDADKGSFTHVYEQNELDLADERIRLAGPVSVIGRVKRSGAEVLIDGKVDTVIEVDCDRCLKVIEMPVDAQFSVEYLSKHDYEAGQAAEIGEDEMGVSVFEGDSIDVDEIVREQILLFVPARAICTENCKGICSACGTDLNVNDCGCVTEEVDPRWAALKNFKKN